MLKSHVCDKIIFLNSFNFYKIKFLKQKYISLHDFSVVMKLNNNNDFEQNVIKGNK